MSPTGIPPRVRALCRRPASSLAAVSVLALGIGLVAAAWSVLAGVLPRGLPGRHGERIVAFSTGLSALWPVSPPDFEVFLRESRTLDEVAGFRTYNGVVTPVEGASHGITVSYVTANLFSMLGIQPALGRGFLASEEDPAEPVPVILSYGLWQGRFGGRVDVLGESVVLNRETMTVVGVMPAGFRFPVRQDAWSVLRPEGRPWSNSGIFTLGRLGRGVGTAAARAELTGISAALDQEAPLPEPRSLHLKGYVEAAIPPGFVRGLRVIYVAALIVLIAACANVASLRLADALRRRQDLLIRQAVGASRGRVTRELLGETGYLVGAGCGLGLILAWLLVAMAGDWLVEGGSLARFYWVDIRFQPGTALVAGLAATLAAVIGGAVPAWLAASDARWPSLPRAAGGTGTSIATRLLVITQVALCFSLLAAGALFTRSAVRLLERPLNYDPTPLVSAIVNTYQAEHLSEPEEGRSFTERLLTQLELHPEVEAASVSRRLAALAVPVVVRRDAGDTAENAVESRSRVNRVLGGYFSTFGLPLLAGREFSRGDSEAQEDSGSEVAILSSSLAARLGFGIVGRHIEVQLPRRPLIHARVIGVVADTGRGPARVENAYDEVYLPFSWEYGGGGLLLVRGRSGPRGLAEIIEEEVVSADRRAVAIDIHSVAERHAWASWTERRLSQLVSLFAVISTLLAGAGLWAVLARLVANRRREIGIRSALGALPWQLRGLVMSESALLAAVGLAAGSVALVLAKTWVAPMLYQTSFLDATSLATAAGLVVAVTILASFFPARAASSVDPAEVLRSE